MERRWMVIVIGICFLATLASGVGDAARHRGQDEKGESKEERLLKNRSTAPKPADIDKGATLPGLLSKKEKSDWSTAKGAMIEGYVIQVEREEDGDYHMVLPAGAGETDTRKWVIVEVTRPRRMKRPSLADAKIKQLLGKRIRVTGWLYYEPEMEQADPRGTKWEIRPVTDVSLLG